MKNQTSKYKDVNDSTLSSFNDRVAHQNTSLIPAYNKSSRLEKKMQNSSWIRHMLKQYFLLTDALRDTPMQQQGIPLQATQLPYVCQMHDQIKQYSIDHANTPKGKEVGIIYDEVKTLTWKLLSKAQRYNLRTRRPNVPKSMGGEQLFNGERIHISLESVL
jgi:hypothetical protein